MRIAILFIAAGLVSGSAEGQLDVNQLPPELAQKVDQVAQQVLEQTGVPSASVAIVRDGAIPDTEIRKVFES